MPVVPLGPPEGRTRWTVRHAGRRYLVLSVGERWVVTDARCPHKGQPLDQGLVRDGCLVCPGHWYAFDLTTGACTNAHETPLPLHPVTVSPDGSLSADIVVAPELSWSERLRAHAREGS